MVDPEPAAARGCDEPRSRQPRDHAPRGRAHAHDPDTPAPEPRVPEPCSIPEDIARLGAERTEGKDAPSAVHDHRTPPRVPLERARVLEDRKSTRLNSSHDQISYAVFCLKKKKRHK